MDDPFNPGLTPLLDRKVNVTVITVEDVFVGLHGTDGNHGSSDRDGTLKSTESSQGLLALVIMLLLLLVIIVYCCWGTCCRVLRKRRRNGAHTGEEDNGSTSNYPSVLILPYGGMVYNENDGEWHNRSISSDISRTGYLNPRTGKVERIRNVPPPSYSSIFGENGTIPPTYSSLDLERLRAWQRSQSQLTGRDPSTSLATANEAAPCGSIPDTSTTNPLAIFTISDIVTVSVPNTVMQCPALAGSPVPVSEQPKVETSPSQTNETSVPVTNQGTRMERLARLFTTRRNLGLPRARSEPAFSLSQQDAKLAVFRTEFPTSSSQKDFNT